MKKALKDMIEKIDNVKVIGNWVKIDGELYPLPLVKGNKKIGNVWHASTLPTNGTISAWRDGVQYTEVGTCDITCNGCYGTNGCYKYNSTKYYLIKRTIFLRKYTEIYFKVAHAQIIAEHITTIRLHATGDFIPNEASGWRKIFKSMPTLKGWTYTKKLIAGEIADLNSLKNFNIVKSIIEGIGFNFGHIDHVLKAYETLKNAGKNVYICRCGIDKNQHCETCTACATFEYVLFIEHSTGYKAEKDPLFETIKTLIEAQPLPTA